MLAQMPAARLYLHHTGAHPLMWSRPHDFRAVADRFLATACAPADELEDALGPDEEDQPAR
jgi:hypothetical protein